MPGPVEPHDHDETRMSLDRYGLSMSYGGNSQQPTQPGGTPQFTQHPPGKGSSTVLMVSIVCITLAVTAIVITFLLTRSDDDASSNASDTPGTVVHTEVRETTTQTEVQTQTVVPNVPTPQNPPAQNDLEAVLAAEGFTLACPNSSVRKQKEETTCEWASKVEDEIRSRGGGFNDVGIYSDGAKTTIYTSCHDQGAYYQCTGRNSTFAVVK
ncbi:MAG: hypothetical protein QM809_18835 [Gordonia sp. (in: high G+C Gram-positive bacteria)]|uniref:hypothetical protein n=1 Tax=Gordonia sp. (in: high G+C Gram-positive bacteria) TaxID=84139 RepID=UPI0039E22711